MSTGVGSDSAQSEEQVKLEQTRLEALLSITMAHKKEVQGLKSQLENAERKAVKLESQVKTLDNELKAHRASNPDRMKKQIKRLQEQNRVILVENNTLKTKHKQLQQQLQSTKVELDRLKDQSKEEETSNAETSNLVKEPETEASTV